MLTNLPLSQISMRQVGSACRVGSLRLSMGILRNTGGLAVTGIMVQVIFRNDEAMPPQIETLPLSLIRTREPYIDTQSVGSSPLKPGDERDFRLIFEAIPLNWGPADA